MNSIELTILMPCLNEEKTIGKCIKEARTFLEEYDVEGEILIANNGSNDDSVSIALDSGARVTTELQKGYGSTLRHGIDEAKGKYIIMGDCDLSYDFYHLDRYLELLRGGAALVMGNRFAGGIEKGAMPFSHRYIGVPVLSWLGRRRYKTFIGDFHCGLRGFNRDDILKLKLHSSGMEFATEMIGRCADEHLRIEEIPTVLRKDGRNGRSHLNSVKDGLRHIKVMI